MFLRFTLRLKTNSGLVIVNAFVFVSNMVSVSSIRFRVWSTRMYTRAVVTRTSEGIIAYRQNCVVRQIVRLLLS